MSELKSKVDEKWERRREEEGRGFGGEWSKDPKQASGRIIGLLRKHPGGGGASTAHLAGGARISDRMAERIAKMSIICPEALNELDMDGRTALCWLGRRRRPDLMRLFLELGADPFNAGGQGVLPLFEAAGHSAGESLGLLARATGMETPALEPRGGGGPDPLAGATALISAAFHSNEGGLSTLLSMGANALARTHEGFTAMHVLGMGAKSMERAWPCVELLARERPELLWMENNGGSLPHDIARGSKSDLEQPLRALWEAMELGRSSEALPPRRRRTL